MTALPETGRLAGPGAGASCAAAAVGLALAAALAVLPLPPAAGLAGLGLYAAVALLATAGCPMHHPHPRFGLANSLTMLRAGGTALLGAAALASHSLGPAGAWAAAALAVGLLALDGLDGPAARRQRLVSRFGARFDMEVDALLVLVLACLAFGLGKVGVWVLAIGLMRYGFVLAGAVLPILSRVLPASRRRQAVCVLQVAVLTLAILPPVPPAASAGLAAAALAALAWSFGRDLRHLLSAA